MYPDRREDNNTYSVDISELACKTIESNRKENDKALLFRSFLSFLNSAIRKIKLIF